MKRKITVVFSLILTVLILSACGKISDIQLPALPSSNPAAQAAPEPKEEEAVDHEVEAAVTEPENETAVKEDAVTVIVSGSTFEKEFEAPDGSGEKILTFSYSTPAVNIDGNPDASNAVNDYLDSVDEAYYSGSEKYSGVNYYHELAIDNYSYVKETGRDINTDFYSVRKFTCRRCDSAVISFVYTTYDYLGVASENYSSEGFCFNTSDGAVIMFNDIADDSDALIDACAAYLSDTDMLNSDILVGLASGSGWFLSDEGLNFFSPDSSSFLENQFYCVPYEEIGEYLVPEYLPSENEDSAEVSVSLVSSDDFTENSVNIIGIAKIDENAESTFLTVKGTAYDISVSSVEYNDFDGTFFVTDTLWYCSSLTDCAVQLEIVPPMGIPEIMISYRDGSGNITQLLAVDGDSSGIISLTDEAIVPLG